MGNVLTKLHQGSQEDKRGSQSLSFFDDLAELVDQLLLLQPNGPNSQQQQSPILASFVRSIHTGDIFYADFAADLTHFATFTPTLTIPSIPLNGALERAKHNESDAFILQVLQAVVYGGGDVESTFPRSGGEIALGTRFVKTIIAICSTSPFWSPHPDGNEKRHLRKQNSVVKLLLVRLRLLWLLLACEQPMARSMFYLYAAFFTAATFPGDLLVRYTRQHPEMLSMLSDVSFIASFCQWLCCHEDSKADDKEEIGNNANKIILCALVAELVLESLSSGSQNQRQQQHHAPGLLHTLALCILQIGVDEDAQREAAGLLLRARMMDSASFSVLDLCRWLSERQLSTTLHLMADSLLCVNLTSSDHDTSDTGDTSDIVHVLDCLQYLHDQQFTEAYETLDHIHSESRRSECLCRVASRQPCLPFKAQDALAVEAHLLDTLRHCPVSESAFKPLLAFYAHRENYRAAAVAVYEYSFRLTDPKMLEEALLIVITCLELCEYKWISFPLSPSNLPATVSMGDKEGDVVLRDIRDIRREHWHAHLDVELDCGLHGVHESIQLVLERNQLALSFLYYRHARQWPLPLIDRVCHLLVQSCLHQAEENQGNNNWQWAMDFWHNIDMTVHAAVLDRDLSPKDAAFRLLEHILCAFAALQAAILDEDGEEEEADAAFRLHSRTALVRRARSLLSPSIDLREQPWLVDLYKVSHFGYKHLIDS